MPIIPSSNIRASITHCLTSLAWHDQPQIAATIWQVRSRLVQIRGHCCSTVTFTQAPKRQSIAWFLAAGIRERRIHYICVTGGFQSRRGIYVLLPSWCEPRLTPLYLWDCGWGDKPAYHFDLQDSWHHPLIQRLSDFVLWAIRMHRDPIDRGNQFSWL